MNKFQKCLNDIAEASEIRDSNRGATMSIEQAKAEKRIKELTKENERLRELLRDGILYLEVCYADWACVSVAKLLKEGLGDNDEQ